MSSPYERGSSAGSAYERSGNVGSAYERSGGGRTGRPVASKKSGGILHGITHVAGQTLKDAGDIAAGLGPGLYHTGKALGQDVAHDVLHGPPTVKDVKKSHLAREVFVPSAKGVAHDFKHPLAHPLYTALDLLTLADAGSSGAARAGLLKQGRSVVEIRSPRARATGEGPVVKKLTDTKPIVRGRQVITNKALNKIAFTRNGVTMDVESARYGREIRRGATQKGLAQLPAYRRYFQATKRLSKEERAALNIIPRDVHPADLAEFWKGTDLEKVVTNPRVQQLVENPTPRLQRALVAARDLSAKGEDLFKDLRFLNDDTAAARPGKFRAQVAETLGREVAPLHGEPFYLPDEMKPVKGGSPFAGAGGGKGVQRRPGSAQLNKGVLARLGKLDIQNDVLGPEFVRRVKATVHDAVHGGLIDASVPLTREQLEAVRAEHGGLPHGWEFVRAPVVTKAGTVRSQRIHQLDQLPGEKGATPETLKDVIPNPDDLRTSELSGPMGTRDERLAHFDGEHYYLAPKTLIRHAAGEFQRSSTAVHYLVEKPLTVWRALVLGLRLGFLTNNVVGNHLMYAIRTAGIGGFRAYLHAVQEAHGSQMVRDLIGKSYVPKGLSKQLMEEFFPEHIEGTFGRTQAPTREGLLPAAGGKLGKTAKNVTGALPAATQAVAETLPRRAAVETFIRKSPEFRAVYKSLPKEARTFDEAARKVLSGEGGAQYQRFISDQVNHALGNYLNMGPVERKVIRNVLPFYSWYRAIASISFHLAADTPGRALMLKQLGEIGNEDVTKILGPLPDYLRGFIAFHVKNGEATGLNTSGLNPYMTIPQLISGATTDVTSAGLSPMIGVPLDVYARASQKGSVGLLPLLGLSLQNLTQNLPLARLGPEPKPSKLYPHKTRKSEAESFAGVPLKTVDLAEAHRRAKP